MSFLTPLAQLSSPPAKFATRTLTILPAPVPDHHHHVVVRLLPDIIQTQPSNCLNVDQLRGGR
jgi:hypothetical protein